MHINCDDNRQLTPEQEAAIESAPCCMGAAIYGAHRCTCWETLYDLDQDDVAEAAPGQRTDMCADCAYRPDSPERNGDPNQIGSEPGALDAIAGRSVFWCHQGIRRVVGYHHPTFGWTVTTPGIAYDPPIRESSEVDGTGALIGVPYRADGTPAERCAGWAARRRQLAAEAAR